MRLAGIKGFALFDYKKRPEIFRAFFIRSKDFLVEKSVGGHLPVDFPVYDSMRLPKVSWLFLGQEVSHRSLYLVATDGFCAMFRFLGKFWQRWQADVCEIS